MFLLSDYMDISKLEPGYSHKINVFIECLKDSKDFCKYDKKTQGFVLKGVLKTPFPGCYGFVPKTHHIDAEPLDVLVLTSDPLQQGIVLEARPIGIVRLKNKIVDDILIAVSLADKKFENLFDLSKLSKTSLERIKQFLEEFKNMEVENIFDAEHAKRSVEHAIGLYKKEFG